MRFHNLWCITVRPTVTIRWLVLLLVLPGIVISNCFLPATAWATTGPPPPPNPPTDEDPECGDGGWQDLLFRHNDAGWSPDIMPMASTIDSFTSGGETCTSEGCSTCPIENPIPPVNCVMPTSLFGTVPPNTTYFPIVYATGAVMESAVDLQLPGPKFGWKQLRTYNSLVANGAVTNLGRNWLSGNGDVRLAMNPDNGSNIDLVVSASSKRTFTWNGSGYIAPVDTALKLVANGTKLELTNYQTGDLWIFHNLTQGDVSGALNERTTLAWKAAGLTGQTYSYNASGHLQTITSAQGQDEQIAFEHIGTSMRLRSIKVGPTNNHYLEVSYTYQGDNGGYDTDLGAADDLVQVRTGRKDSAGNWVYRYIQYRYQGDGKLKMVLEADAIRWIIDNDGAINTAADILTKADTASVGSTGKQIKDVSNRSFTYYTSTQDTTNVTTPWTSGEDLHSKYGGSQLDETGRVKTETVNGGCASCGSGSSIGVTRTFFYMARNGGLTETNADKVSLIVVEDAKDSVGTAFHRKVAGLSKDAIALREALIEDPLASPLKVWCESKKLDSSLRVTERRQPSAHTLIDSNSELALFLDPTTSTNDAATLNDSDGVIYSYVYDISGTRVFDTKVKKGENGTACYVTATDFGDGDGDNQGRDKDDQYLVTATLSYPTATTSRTAGNKTQYVYTFHDSGDTGIAQRTTTLPSVPTSENGSGAAATAHEYYDTASRLRWVKDGEGYVHYISYHPENGQPAFRMVDVNTSSLSSDITSGSSGNWLSWSGGAVLTRDGSLPSALQLITKIEYDDETRTTLLIDVDGKQHFTVYRDNQTILFPYWDGSDSLGPIQVADRDDTGELHQTYMVAGTYANISIASSKPTGFSTQPGRSDYLSLTKYAYHAASGKLDHVDAYHLIPASGDTLSTHFNRTVFKYDTRGRKQYTIQTVSGTATNSSIEQVTQTVYDVLNRKVQTKRGVSGNSHDMTSDYTNYPTLAVISDSIYDGGGTGDSHVTKTKSFFGTGGSDYTAMAYHYTYRGHLRGTEPQDSSSATITPVTLRDVDWLGQTTATAQLVVAPTWSSILSNDGYDEKAAASSQSDRRALSTIVYDVLGRVYRTDRYLISATDGSKGDKLRIDTYYDRNNHAVAGVTYGQAATELVYDGAGREYQTRTVKSLEGGDSGAGGTFYSSGKFLYRDPQPAPSFSASSASAMSGGDDQVLEITHRYLDAVGNPLETHTFEVNHNDSDGLSVAETGGGTRDYVRRSVYSWYDAANRLTTTADYGSGDTTSGAGSWKYASMPSRASAPSGSASDVLAATYTYDDSGRQATMARKQTASKAVTNKTLYDALGRKRYQVANYVDFSWTPSSDSISNSGGGTLLDEDNVTGWQYNGLGSVTKLIAYDQNADGTATDNETTEYKFEDVYNANLQTKAIYPDSSSGSDVVTNVYALDGLMTQRTDQRGTVIDFTYNISREIEKQTASTLGGSTDGGTRAIKREYDTLGRVEKITSFSDTATSTAINQIVYEYDNFGRTVTSFQEHAGVKGGSTPKVEYTYDDTAASGLLLNAGRANQMNYPTHSSTQRIVTYGYGSSGSPDDQLSRVASLQQAGASLVGTKNLTTYLHSGTSRLVEVRYKLDSVNPELYLDRGFSSGDYASLDRFGWVKKQLWKTSSSTLDEFNYEHDLMGNRTGRDLASGSRDQLYNYDGLNRLVSYDEGSITSGSIASPTKEADWTLDGLGNWPTYVEKLSGSTTLDQTRAHNTVNEIGTITASTGANWIDPVHDAAGNTTEAPKPTAETTKHKCIWDAWNRLAKVTDASNVSIAEFEYDGLGRRIRKAVDQGSGTTADHDYYLSEQNQVVQELVYLQPANTRVEWHEMVWHPYYVDALATRYYNNSTVSKYYFTLHDANYNVTALVDNAAAAQERVAYTPYGLATFLDASYANPVSTSTANVNQKHLYTGRQLDYETLLYYYRARYYHPALGRFVARDPIEYDSKDTNLYRYVAGNPVAATDPSGNDTAGCNVPAWVGGTQADNSPCTRACCAQHDACFDLHDCGMYSWGWNVGGGLGGGLAGGLTGTLGGCGVAGAFSKCASCNNTVATCFARCGIGNHMQGKHEYYCAALGGYITIAGAGAGKVPPNPPIVGNFPNLPAAENACQKDHTK
jgi:RHS repeat-associated protein